MQDFFAGIAGLNFWQFLGLIMLTAAIRGGNIVRTTIREKHNQSVGSRL
jgi:hypothetical protein